MLDCHDPAWSAEAHGSVDDVRLGKSSSIGRKGPDRDRDKTGTRLVAELRIDVGRDCARTARKLWILCDLIMSMQDMKQRSIELERPVTYNIEAWARSFAQIESAGIIDVLVPFFSQVVLPQPQVRP